MSNRPIAIRGVGLVTSVGLTAAASCAAMRAKLSCPSETRFANDDGSWLMAHQVPLARPWRGIRRLAKMVVPAIADALAAVPAPELSVIPLLLCVAEAGRPGRIDGLDGQLLGLLESELGLSFSARSAVVALGRVGVAFAFEHARQLLAEPGLNHVVVAAVDSLLAWPTLTHYARQGRLLVNRHSDGFMPGEAGGALLLGTANASRFAVECVGIGFGDEPSPVESTDPLRGAGLLESIRASLDDAGCAMHDIGVRISALSGEQYFFKEASLALDRALRKRQEQLDLWHPAESIGECGAASGMAAVVLAHAAACKGFAPGRLAMLNLSNDDRWRASMVLRTA